MASVTRVLAAIGLIAAASSFFAGSAQAQATRTWVSGVGDDANPCSRTAPCKTFAGAISKTTPGGEINCLDPGGFGALTITKAITINCDGTFGSVLVAGTSGIVVAAQPADRVILRGLEFDGLGSNSPNDGVNGIRFISGQSLLVDKCIIYGFVNNGIDVVLGAAASVDVKDTVISNIGRAGIRITSTGGGAALAVERVNISRVGANGIEVAGGGLGAVNNSMLFGNGGGVAASVAALL
jgi:hypothetical protein